MGFSYFSWMNVPRVLIPPPPPPPPHHHQRMHLFQVHVFHSVAYLYSKCLFYYKGLFTLPCYTMYIHLYFTPLLVYTVKCLFYYKRFLYSAFIYTCTCGLHITVLYCDVYIMIALVCTLGWTQRIQTKNVERFLKAVWERPKGLPLVTVSNHTSYIDDPGFLRMYIYSYVQCYLISTLIPTAV